MDSRSQGKGAPGGSDRKPRRDRAARENGAGEDAAAREAEDADDDGAGGAEGAASASSPAQEPSGGLTDLARRIFAAGAVALLDRDEGLRRFMPELPKEMVGHVLQLADRLRVDILGIIGREFRSFLDRLKLAEELRRILTSTVLEVRTSIRFVPNEQTVVWPVTQTTTKVRGAQGDGDGDGPGGDRGSAEGASR